MSSAARAFASCGGFPTERVESRQEPGAALDAIEGGRKGHDPAVARVTGDGAHDQAELLRTHFESGKSRHPKQADVVTRRNCCVQAREQVADLGCVGDIHGLDDEGNAGFGQLLDHIVAVEVRPIQNAEVGPLALQFLAGIADHSDQVGAFRIFCREHHHRNWKAREGNACAGGFFASGLERRAAIG